MVMSWFKVKEVSVCVRVGFQGLSKQTYKVILDMIYVLYRNYCLVTLT